jgi:hypothetical protein
MEGIEMTHAEFYENVQRKIDEHGRSVVSVFPSPTSLAFAYTIGNHLKNLPELLIVINLHPEQSVMLLNEWSEQMIERGREFADGELIRASPEDDLMVRAAHCRPEAKSRYTVQAGQFFEHEDYRVTQIILCDPKGRFPGDPHCARGYSDQPNLGYLR